MKKPKRTNRNSESTEREARNRFAWGQYSASVRGLNLDQKLTEIDKKIRTASGTNRQTAEEERRELIEKVKRENRRGLYIG